MINAIKKKKKLEGWSSLCSMKKNKKRTGLVLFVVNEKKKKKKKLRGQVVFVINEKKKKKKT